MSDTVVVPEVRRIESPQLAPPEMPENPADCSVLLQLFIGPAGGDAQEEFTFTVVTPANLLRETGPLWGRGLLILPAFHWTAVAESIAIFLAQCARPTWEEVVEELERAMVRAS